MHGPLDRSAEWMGFGGPAEWCGRNRWLGAIGDIGAILHEEARHKARALREANALASE